MPFQGKDISLICHDEKINREITRHLVKKDYIITKSSSLTEGLSKVYEAPPALIMIHEPLLKGKALRLLKSFKQDNLFSHIPVVLLVEPEWEKNDINWDSYPVEDYLAKGVKTEELLKRVSLCVSRFNRALDPNPLTRLPGNTSILRTIQQELDFERHVAISYLDIDNFKAFNDRYGFARGDEALRMTARILSNVIHTFRDADAFVGHVGGDDFVFLVPADFLDEACSKIIAGFDSIIPSLYEEEDRNKKAIISKSRSGETQSFPLMSVSIAVVINKDRRFKHYGEVSEIASQIKKQVKKLAGSNYMIDRRQTIQ